MFGQFGRVLDVELFDEDESAYVTFQDFFEAWYAQQSLNGYFLANAGVHLLVKWLPAQAPIEGPVAGSGAQHQLRGAEPTSASGEQMSTDRPEFMPSAKAGLAPASKAVQPLKAQQMNAISTPAEQLGSGSGNTFAGAQAAGAGLVAPSKFEQENIHTSASSFVPQLQTSSHNFIPSAPSGGLVASSSVFQPTAGAGMQANEQSEMGGSGSGDASAKYTCRYDIQIPNEREFQVARRLIGAKGCNMKRIISQCQKNMPQVSEVVKLRLRGKGSGFKEGPKQEESKEPLHLCISSRFYQQYTLACQQIEQLLLNVYEDFKKHCERTKKDIRSNNGGGILQIKKFETVTGRRTQIQPLHNTYPVNQQSCAPSQPLPGGQGNQQSFGNVGNGSREANIFKQTAQDAPAFLPSSDSAAANQKLASNAGAMGSFEDAHQQQPPQSSAYSDQPSGQMPFGHFASMIPPGMNTYMPMPNSAHHSVPPSMVNPFQSQQQHQQFYGAPDRGPSAGGSGTNANSQL